MTNRVLEISCSSIAKRQGVREVANRAHHLGYDVAMAHNRKS